MSGFRPARLLAALASGFALALAFPLYDVPLVAWIAFAPLFVAVIGSRRRWAFLYGFLHGAVSFSLMLTWIYTVMRVYGNVPILPAAGILELIAFAWGTFTGTFALALAHWSRRSPACALWLAPFAWVAIELARTHLPIIGFPWNLAGYAVSGNLALVQLASWTGIYGLSFVLLAFNALVAWVWRSRSRRSVIAVAAAAVFLLVVSLAGPRLVPRATPGYVAHLVQTNFPQSESYPPDWNEVHEPELHQLEALSVDSARAAPGLIVWPEVPAPFSLADQSFAERARRIAVDSGQDFLVGVVDWNRDAAGQWMASNSAVLLDPSGRRVFAYDKMHLVPFGEYVPLRRWLTFAAKLTADIGDFHPGAEARVGSLPGGRFGVFICYEAVFPNEVRRFVKNGAELLINISNDGWFGNTAAPAQHLAMARVRAVENRRWLLRDTNTGITVSVDPYGRIVARLAADVRGQLDAPYGFRSGRTIYVRFGDWLAYLSVAIVALALVLVRAGVRRPVSASQN